MGTILVVDDEPDMIRYLRILLEEDEGHQVLGASDGGEALDVLRSADVDLVVLDLLMPHMDGFEFLREFRGAGDKRPVVVLTALSDSIGGACERGATLAMAKPFDPDRLVEVIAKLLEANASPA